MLKLKTKDFARWARKHRLNDKELLKVVSELEQGLLGDRLGAYLFKKRVKLPGRGKRGGARFIICYIKNDRLLFLEGYAKNEQEDLNNQEVEAYRLFAKEFSTLSPTNIKQALREGILILLKET